MMGKNPDGREVIAALVVCAAAELGLVEDSVRTEVRKPLMASVDVASATAVSVVLASVAVFSSATELGKVESSETTALEEIRLDNSRVDVGVEVTSVVDSSDDTTDVSAVVEASGIREISPLVVVTGEAASSTACKKSDAVLSLQGIGYDIPTKQGQEEASETLIIRQVLPSPKLPPWSRQQLPRLPQLLLVQLPVVCRWQVLGEVSMGQLLQFAALEAAATCLQ